MDCYDGLSYRELRAIKRQRLRDLAEVTESWEKWHRRHDRMKALVEIARAVLAANHYSAPTSENTLTI